MKFERHFQDTHTPEWKWAYIDYRRLQAELETMRAPALAQAEGSYENPDVDSIHDPEPYADSAFGYKMRSASIMTEEYMYRGNKTFGHVASPWVLKADPGTDGPNFDNHGSVAPTRPITNRQRKKSLSLTQTPSAPVFPCFKDSDSPVQSPLYKILSSLPLDYAKFFDMLDDELAKVESFYIERENEMVERAKRLREQLEELSRHRQTCRGSTRTCRFVLPILSSLRWFSYLSLILPVPHQVFGSGIFASGLGHNGSQALEHRCSIDDHSGFCGTNKGAAEKGFGSLSSKTGTASAQKTLYGSAKLLPRLLSSLFGFGRTEHTLDPSRYRHAKRQLRNAFLEHYRGLILLNNYRILNLTGFRKVLKKYGKITELSVLEAYMEEKLGPSAFASGDMVATTLKKTENLFAMHFERGNRKKAIHRLRGEPSPKSYHFNTFRIGLWLGLAVPAIGVGCYLSFQEYTRRSLPSWDILVFIHSIFLVPVLMALLIGINIFVWARTRVNHVLIFELNSRSRLDYREYLELPSFLLCTLAYSFLFSLARIGSPAPWPLIWLTLTFVVMFNPSRSLMWGHARWWAIKNTAELGVCMLRSAEFTHAWLADQACSLVYSLSNLYFVGCYYASFSSLLSSAYNLQGQDAWSTCTVAQNLGWYCLLGVVPFMTRFVQTLRQYRDSKMPICLINTGKYGIAMLQYLCYCYWRYQAAPRSGHIYAFWCFVATVNALYGCAWDFLMDWSLLEPHARYPILRRELVYKSHVSCYYFAIVFNVFVRFFWLRYIFVNKAHTTQDMFISALLEVLRRVQWNIYRLESSHIKNIEQHHVIREVRLPYSVGAQSNNKARVTPARWRQQATPLRRKSFARSAQ